MHTIEQLGLPLIIAIQEALRPGLDGFFRTASYLGEEPFYMLVIPALYWCVDRGTGVRMLAFLVVNSLINDAGKMLLGGPRPYWIESRITGLYPESSFGVPSGHSQNGLGVWLYLAILLRRLRDNAWFVPVALSLAFLISFSRLYLGVHFPHDLVGGWVLALIVVWLFLGPGEKLLAKAKDWSLGKQIAAGSAAACVLGGLALLVYATQKTNLLPPDWTTRALAAHTALGKAEVLPKPYSAKLTIAITAMLLAVAIAWPLSLRFAAFDPGGSATKRIARYALGLLVLTVIQFGLAAVFPKEGQAGYEALRFLRYLLTGFWAILGAPIVFLRLNLAQPAGPR